MFIELPCWINLAKLIMDKRAKKNIKLSWNYYDSR